MPSYGGDSSNARPACRLYRRQRTLFTAHAAVLLKIAERLISMMMPPCSFCPRAECRLTAHLRGRCRFIYFRRDIPFAALVNGTVSSAGGISSLWRRHFASPLGRGFRRSPAMQRLDAGRCMAGAAPSKSRRVVRLSRNSHGHCARPSYAFTMPRHALFLLRDSPLFDAAMQLFTSHFQHAAR